MNWMHITLLVQLLLLVPVAFSRPGVPAVPDSAAAVTVAEPAAPTPVPTVSTVLANDTAIANQFIDHLNLTDISVSILNRRLHTVNHNNQAKVPASAVVVSSPTNAGKAHHGVAVPMTLEELEAEMASVTAKPTVRYALRTTTARDGITTWIPAEATTVKSASASFGSQKMDKIAKVKVDVVAVKPNKPAKVKFVPSSPKTASNGTTTTAPTTVAPPSSTTAKPNVAKKSPTRPPKTTTTTTAADNIADIHTDLPSPTTEQTRIEGSSSTAEPADEIRQTTKETPTPFLVLEPKDADFDLPQDRSPGKPTPKKPKRPAKGNGKKKPANHKTTTDVAIVDDASDSANLKNSTKSAVNTKLKQKPMTTQIYNYLSREIMPTVGVGLLGLMVTAGIAGYFLNPLGALRRSYEVADRKDDLYHYNNEEYAGSGPSDGQSEEEIFGKVIAGMPVHSTYRNNIRYAQPAQQQQLQQQQQQPQYRHPNQYSKPYSAAGASGPPAQYSRYRNVHQMPAQAKPSVQQQPQQHPGHYAAYAAHYGQQRNTQQLNPNVLIQKSIASSMYAQQPQQQQQQQQQQQSELIEDRVVTPPASITIDHTPASEPITTTSNSPPPAQNADTLTSSTAMPSVVFSYTDRSYTDQYLDTNPNELRRRSQFVVGSVVLADAQAAALTSDPADAPSNYPSVVLPEHGPRRRRRRSLMPLILGAAEVAADTPQTDDADIADGGPEARSFDLNINDAEVLYEQLRTRFEHSAPIVRGDKQLLKEMKRLDYQVTRLRRVIAEAKDIEQFQSELSLEPKNGELHDTLNNGLVQITSDIRFVGELLDDPKLIGEKIADRQMMSKRMALTALLPPKQVATDRADDANAVLKEGESSVVVAEDATTVTVKPGAASGSKVPPKSHHTTPPTTNVGGGISFNVTHSFEYTTTPKPSFFLGLLKMLELKSAFGVNVLRSIRPAFDRAVADVFRVNQTMYNHN